MREFSITAISDRALSLHASSSAEARAFGDVLRMDDAWQDVVPGLNSVSVHFDPVALPMSEARVRLLASVQQVAIPDETVRAEPLRIPVHYGDFEGPDLDHVAGLLGMSAAKLIDLHTACLFEVEIMGFLPGFAYLGGLDPQLAVARRAEPRLRVPAGAVAIGGDRAGIYSLEGSGGWQVVGRTHHQLFDAAQADPFVLRPGMTIKFEAA